MRSGREAIQKKQRALMMGQWHGWPRGLSPLAMTQMKLNKTRERKKQTQMMFFSEPQSDQKQCF